MKKICVSILALVFLSVPLIQGAEKKSESLDKFYGKITNINPETKSLTVHNQKRKQDADFRWDESTKILMKKNSVQANQLSVGQSLIVGYVVDADVNRAKRITVRPPLSRNKKKKDLTLVE